MFEFSLGDGDVDGSAILGARIHTTIRLWDV